MKKCSLKKQEEVFKKVESFLEDNCSFIFETDSEDLEDS